MKRIPHTFTIVCALRLLAAVCTWIVPAGEFVRERVEVQTADGGTSTREVVQSGSFHYVESEPQTWQVFASLFNGFVDKADIIVFILMVGGAFWILNNSHAIDVGVTAFLRKVLKLNKYRIFKRMGVENIIIALIMIMFSLFGAVFGMSEETIAFVIIFVPLAISMGYDSITGVLCGCTYRLCGSNAKSVYYRHCSGYCRAAHHFGVGIPFPVLDSAHYNRYRLCVVVREQGKTQSGEVTHVQIRRLLAWTSLSTTG